MTPEEYAKYLMEKLAQEKWEICVIYNPNCGCPLDQFVLLDRYPMSKKIISQCPDCKKGCLMEISDPIIFHLPLTNTDFSIKDLKEGVVMDSWQREFIEQYRNSEGD